MPAFANRSAGTGESACATATATGSGTVGRASRTSGAVLVNRFAITACAVGPVNGGSPANIS